MKNFNKIIFIQSTVCFIFLIIPSVYYFNNFLYEIISAFFLSLGNLLISNFLINISFEKSNSEYLQVVYGGMLIRLAIILFFSLFMTMNGYFDTLSFFITFFIFYTMHQATEIIHWHRNLPIRKVTP